ncbi:MAG: redoxin domain-containing protein [Flavobacteriales bacterium]|nr:redoxin domain-containing protein [Flavobacteriales bacterium]
MKKLFLFCCIVFLSLGAFSQKDAYKIRIKINGKKDVPVYLINYFGEQRYYKDTAAFNSEGVAVFTGPKHLPGGIYGLFSEEKLLFELLLNEEPLVDLETDTEDYINHMKVKKSEENKLFFEHLALVTKKQEESKPLQERYNAKDVSEAEKKEISVKLEQIGEDINTYRLGIVEKYPDMLISVIYRTMKEPKAPEYPELSDSLRRVKQYYYVKSHYFDDVDFGDERINYTPLYHNKLEKYFKQLVVPVPDSIIKEADIIIARSKANQETFKYTVHYLLSHYERSKIMGMDAVFSHIGLNYYTHELAFWADSAQIEKVQERASKISPLLIGKPAINLSLLDTAGTNWPRLYHVSSKYTVLVFWDPDCGHCKKEMPKLAHYVDSVKNTYDLKVYAVSSQHDEAWKKFIRDHKLDFINVAVPMEVYKDQNKATELIINGHTDLRSLNYHTTYDVYSTPQIYLLDRNKKILGKKLDTDLIDEVIKKTEEKEKNK